MQIRPLDATKSTEKRPEVLAGQTIRVESPLGTVFVTLNEKECHPFELFLNIGKCGSDVSADAEAIGRLCSLLLRIPSPIPESVRIEWIIQNLEGIGGSKDIGFGKNRIRSLPDAVSIALQLYMQLRNDGSLHHPAPAGKASA
jgi:ribonucleoside-diphosphate reductase alpha chain